MTNVAWLPMLVFEVALALRLLIKGGAAVTVARGGASWSTGWLRSRFLEGWR